MACLLNNTRLNALQASLTIRSSLNNTQIKSRLAHTRTCVRKKRSSGQQVQRSRMRKANVYAKAASARPGAQAAYEKICQPGEHLYNKVVLAYRSGTTDDIIRRQLSNGQL